VTAITKDGFADNLRADHSASIERSIWTRDKPAMQILFTCHNVQVFGLSRAWSGTRRLLVTSTVMQFIGSYRQKPRS